LSITCSALFPASGELAGHIFGEEMSDYDDDEEKGSPRAMSERGGGREWPTFAEGAVEDGGFSIGGD
jgi:hypothetical protein